MSTIVLHIEDKVSTNLFAVFKSLTSAHFVVGVILVLLVCFQFCAVSLFVITTPLICANRMILIIVAMELMPKLMSWISPVASKLGLIL